MSALNDYLKKNKIELFQNIESKDKEVTYLYEKIFSDFLKVKIFKKNFYLFFKEKIKNILLHTDIGEKNLYKNNDEITDFLKFISTKFIKKKKTRDKIKFLLLENYKKNFVIKEILKNFLKSHYLFIRYFFYSFKFIFKNFFIKKKNDNNETIIFSYLLNCKDPINFKSDHWGEISSILKEKKITWIHHTFINKANIKDKNLEKFYIESKKNKNKDEHLFLEELISIHSFLIIYFSYLFYFFKNLFLFFLMKFNLKKNNSIKAFYYFHEKILIESMFGSSFMRALIFNEHFRYIFKKFKLFKQILYLKENLSWEKSFLDNLNQSFSNKKKIYGYLHTPIRFWDLKLNQINQNIHSYPSEDLLVCSSICKKKLQNKLDNKNNVYLVESLRFTSKNKIKNKFVNKRNNKKFLLLGSFNEQSTQNMINQVIDYIRVYKQNIKVDLKLHPLSNIKLDKKMFNITKLDLGSLLTNNKYDMIFIDSDSSISLELILNNFNFLIYKDPNNLNTSFLRNNKKFIFFSNYKQIKILLKKNIYSTNSKSFGFLNSSRYSRWKKILS